MIKNDMRERITVKRLAALGLSLALVMTVILPAAPAQAESREDMAYKAAQSDPDIAYLPGEEPADNYPEAYLPGAGPVSLMEESGDPNEQNPAGENPGSEDPSGDGETPGTEDPEVPAVPDMTDITLAPSVTAYRTGYALPGTNPNEGTVSVAFENIPEGCDMTKGDGVTRFGSVTSSNKAVLPVRGISLAHNVLTFRFLKGGSSQVSFILNGKEFSIRARCYRPRIAQTFLLMYKKQKKSVTVKGVPAGIRIRYTSSNKSVASVSSEGVVKALKEGNAVIYVKVGGVKVGTVASVTTAKKVRAVKRARKIGHSSRYSQPLRMQQGYYDCSSLVYRAYKPEGINFGSTSWAPVAADEARYLSFSDKLLYKKTQKNLQRMRYQAGDLLFMTGAKNGRFKGIYHVEMFRGYRFIGFTEANKPVLVSLWANYEDGYADNSGTGIIGRP